MKNTNQSITPNNGYLGSRIDEDRSEFRYLMRIAELVNHQTVERILHFFKREVSLFECVLTSLVALCCSSETARYGAAAFEVYSRVSFTRKRWCLEENSCQTTHIYMYLSAFTLRE